MLHCEGPLSAFTFVLFSDAYSSILLFSYSLQGFACYALYHCRRQELFFFHSLLTTSGRLSLQQPSLFCILNQSWANHWVASLSYVPALCSSLLAFAAYYRLDREVKCVVVHGSAEVCPCISEFSRKNAYHGWLAVMKDMRIKINCSGEN